MYTSYSDVPYENMIKLKKLLVFRDKLNSDLPHDELSLALGVLKVKGSYLFPTMQSHFRW